MAKLGRPPIYSKELAQRICDLIASGETDASIEKMDGMPSARTINRWRADNSGFCHMYARAREARADYRADRIDEYVKKVIAGELKADVARVVIDAEKWLMSKEQPKRYGDKIAHVGGDENDNPIRYVDEADAFTQRISRLHDTTARSAGKAAS